MISLRDEEERVMCLESLIQHLGGVEDPRGEGKIEHWSLDIPVSAACAVVACRQPG